MFGSMCAEERKEMETAKARAIGRVEKVVVHNLTISFCLKVRLILLQKNYRAFFPEIARLSFLATWKTYFLVTSLL